MISLLLRRLWALALDEGEIELNHGVEQVDGFTPISYQKHEPFELRAKAYRKLGEEQKATWDEQHAKALLDDFGS